MAWPNPFRRWNDNTRTCWGYTFDLGPDHFTPEIAHPLKHSYDLLGEECLNVLNELFPSRKPNTDTKTEAQDVLIDPKPKLKRDLYLLLKDNQASHPKLQELWNQVNDIPTWVDWEQIARGQDVFYRYGGATVTGLAYQSLLGGMGANRVVEVLARTGGFGVNVARHRLFETTQHILECTRSLESIKPGGSGFASSIRVRLLHAAVRQRIMKLTSERPSYYSVEKFGVPINDLDSIATIATFSASTIWVALPRQGIFLRDSEIEDYVALWRLIAYYVGTPTDFFATPTKARAAMESLLLNEIHPSQLSKTLANNIIRALENQAPAYASRSFLEANARWLNGNELCDELGLGNPSLYYWCLVGGQCIFFMGLCYFYRSIPYLDRKKVKNLKRIFWQVIVEGKYGLQGDQAVFEFKYIPQFDTTTYKGDGKEIRPKERGVEERSLKALVMGVATIGIFGWIGLKITTFTITSAWRCGSAIIHVTRRLLGFQ